MNSPGVFSESTSRFEDLAEQVYRWAFRVLGGHQDALDVVQDVFLAWNRERAGDSKRNERGWLRTVTMNRAIDLIRNRRAAQEARTRVGRAASAKHKEPVWGNLEREELRTRIAMDLGDLSDMQRAVLVAKVYDDRTFAQVASELGLAVGTVKTHYLRAVQALRNRWLPEWTKETLA